MSDDRTPNRVSPEGRAAGFQLAMLTEPAIADLVREGEADERCKSCAFRLGTVPNGCLQTQLDALKAVVEDKLFMCHQQDRVGKVCHGWFAARVAIDRAEIARGARFEAACPWDFSPPDGPEETAHG